MLKLSRKMELHLINLGFEKLLEKTFPPVAKHPRKKKEPETKTGRQWSDSQRTKFKRTMKKVWKARKAAQ